MQVSINIIRNLTKTNLKQKILIWTEMIRPLKLFFSVCECKYMTVIRHINQKINIFLSFENSKFKI